MNKPANITKNDWLLLVDKYSNNMAYLEQKLKQQYPVQYLIGHVNFCGHQINVDERVLIPRFETEELVEKTLKYIKSLNIINPKILDIGTGSGCIAISLSKKLPNAEVTAIDISESALELAKVNAKNNHVNIKFIKKDITHEIIEELYDVVISNPPYVDENEVYDEQIKYEPHDAIFAYPSCKFYEVILKNIKNQIKLVALETGISQDHDLKLFSGKYFPGHNLIIEQDLSGRNRFAFLIKK